MTIANRVSVLSILLFGSLFPRFAAALPTEYVDAYKRQILIAPYEGFRLQFVHIGTGQFAGSLIGISRPEPRKGDFLEKTWPLRKSPVFILDSSDTGEIPDILYSDIIAAYGENVFRLVQQNIEFEGQVSIPKEDLNDIDKEDLPLLNKFTAHIPPSESLDQSLDVEIYLGLASGFQYFQVWRNSASKIIRLDISKLTQTGTGDNVKSIRKWEDFLDKNIEVRTVSLDQLDKKLTKFALTEFDKAFLFEMLH